MIKEYRLPDGFAIVNSGNDTVQYLNKYTGDWFNLDSAFCEIVPLLKDGISLAELQRFSKQEQDVIFSLLETGVLTDPGKGHEIKEPSPERHQVTLVIIEAQSYCNLACTYCFEDVPTKGFKMANQTADKIVESISRLNLAKNFTVEFNGGESFSNLPILKRLVAQIRSNPVLARHQIKFGVTTNATFINDEIVSFIKDNWIGVTVSLDGVAEDHDKYRVYKSGSGSFKHVMKTLEVLKASGIPFNTISVISNAPQIHRTYAFLKDQRIPRLSLAIRRHSDRMPLHDEHYEAMAEAHYEVFRDSLERFARGEFAPALMDYAVFIKNIIKPHDPDYMCLRTPCGAGKNMITYDTKGDIYACQDLIKEPAFRICSADEKNPQQVIDEHSIVKKLSERKPGGNRGCEDCNWQHFCQGGCYSTSYFGSGKNLDGSFTTKTPHCEYFFHTFSLLMKDFLKESHLLVQYAYADKTIGEELPIER